MLSGGRKIDVHVDSFGDSGQPQDAYGLEKLATEELCKHYTKDFKMECRIGRFHNIYGPFGTWKGNQISPPPLSKASNVGFCRMNVALSIEDIFLLCYEALIIASPCVQAL